MNSKTLEITYNILYNSSKFNPEREVQIACWIESEKIFTDYDDSFTADPIKDIKNIDLENTSDDYSNYENRTSIWEVEYKSRMSKPIEELVNLFQFDQDSIGLMMDFELEKVGDIEVIKIGNFNFQEMIRNLKNDIINLLKKNDKKISVSDINALLKHKDIDQIKRMCKEMYNAGEIDFAGNGRYFVLTEEKEKPKKISAPKSEEVDVEKELEKLKVLLDKGLINQEQYDAKSNELLGL